MPTQNTPHWTQAERKRESDRNNHTCKEPISNADRKYLIVLNNEKERRKSQLNVYLLESGNIWGHELDELCPHIN